MTGDAQTERLAHGTASRRLARGGLLNLAGSFFSAGAQFALVVVVTRLADPGAAAGFFVLVSLTVLAATVATFGTGTGLIYFLSRFRALDRWDLAAPVFKRALWPVLCGLVVASGLVALLADPIVHLVGLDDVNGATGAVRLLAVTIPASAMVIIFTSASRGLGSYRVTVINSQLVQPILQLALVVAVATTGLLALTAAWTLPIIGTAITCAIATRILYRQRLQVLSDATKEPTRERAFWSYTAPLGIVLILKSVIQRADVLVLSAVGSASQVLLYVAATRYLVLGQVVNRSMNWTLQPRVAASLAAGDRAAARSAYGLTTGWLILISWPISIGCLLFPKSLLQLVGGVEFRSAANILMILAGSMLIAAACGNIEAMLAMLGRSRLNLAIAVLTVTINLALLFWLIPVYGSLGAALAWAAAVVVSNLIPAFALAKLEHMSPIGRSSGLAMGLSVVSTLVLGGCIRLLGGDAVLTLGVTVLACGLVHLGGVWMLRYELGLGGIVHRGVGVVQ